LWAKSSSHPPEYEASERCLVPGHSEKKDAICILFSSQVPFVLREHSGGKKILIGDAYVYGIMNGEALEAPLNDMMTEEKFELT
jgi:hypothetical protein